MKDQQNIINWKNVFEQSESFKNNTPFKFGFIKEFFNRNFYERLYETFPKPDNTWWNATSMQKSQIMKHWGIVDKNEIVAPGEDPSLSEEWNLFKKYVESDEFFENIRKFSGIPVNKLKHFSFSIKHKDDFQVSHAHNTGPNILILMIYFTKGWNDGEPGGTYVATKLDDESSIIFEAYDLDNSVTIFHDGPKAIHGQRRITKYAERKAIQLTLEMYDEKTGWYGPGSLIEQKNELITL